MALTFVKSHGAAPVESRFHALLSTTRVFAAIGGALTIGLIGAAVYFVGVRTGGDSNISTNSIPEGERKAAADAKAEADRIAAQKAEADRVAAQQAAEKAEAERKAALAAKAEADRIAAQKAEADRIAAQKAEADRVAALKALAKAETKRNAAAAAKAEAYRMRAQEADRIRAQRERKRTKIAETPPHQRRIEPWSGPRHGTAPKPPHTDGRASSPPGQISPLQGM